MKVAKGRENSKIFVGSKDHPVAVIKRGEIAEYITSEVMEFFTCWKRFNLGFGLPLGGSWLDYPDRFVSILGEFESAWRSLKHGNI